MPDESRGYTGRGAGPVPEPVAEIAAVMTDFPAHWALCGGWAIDAWLGRPSREHGDVDISIFHGDQLAVFQYLRDDWQLIAHDPNVPDATTDPWTGRLLDLPAHIHARRHGADKPLGDALNPAEDGFGLDIELGDLDDGEWVLRREPRVAVPMEMSVGYSAWDIPTVKPVVLLAFKAQEVRLKDQDDFAALLPRLTPEGRLALSRAVAKIDRGHPWLEKLGLRS